MMSNEEKCLYAVDYLYERINLHLTMLSDISHAEAMERYYCNKNFYQFMKKEVEGYIADDFAALDELEKEAETKMLRGYYDKLCR